MSWLAAFVLTTVIELSVVMALCAATAPTDLVPVRTGPDGRIEARPVPLIAAVVVGNLITHPLLWFVGFPALGPSLGWAWTLAVTETLVVVVEAAILGRVARVPPVEAVAVSTCANGASILAGLVLAAR